MQSPRLISLLGWLLSLCVQLLPGIDRDRRLDQLHHTAWTMKDGAPGDIRALAQTTDGYLWLGAPTGLYRFDGIRFERYRASSPGEDFPAQSIYSLFAVPDGGLWIGFWTGGVCFMKDGKLQFYGEQDGLLRSPIIAFARDQSGTIWAAGNKGGLGRFSGGRWHTLGEDSGFSGSALSVFVDRNGTLWVGTVDKLFFLPKEGGKFQVAADQLAFVMRLSEAPDGTLWMAETARGVRRVPLVSKPATINSPQVTIGSQAILVDDQGSLWITSLGDGLRRVPDPELLRGLPNERVAPAPETFTRKNGLTADLIFNLLQDREGNIWTATKSGLDRFRQSPFVSIPVTPDKSVTALFEGEPGVVWVGQTPVGPTIRIEKGVSTYFKELWNLDRVYRDLSGVAWIGSILQLWRFVNEQGHRPDPVKEHADYLPVPTHLGESTLRAVVLPPSTITETTRVLAITKDRSGRLWISISGRGVFRLDRKEWISLESLGGPKAAALSAQTDSAGRVWFGFPGDQVAVVQNDKVQLFSRDDGVQVGDVLSLQSVGSDLWIGGVNGLGHFSGGRFRRVFGAGGEAFHRITAILESNGLWINDTRGVIHIPESEIKLFLSDPGHQRLSFEIFDTADGLPPHLNITSSPSAIRTSDGVLWFDTGGGVAWIDPKRLVRNPVPATAAIETVTAGGRKYTMPAELVLPPGIDNLHITYTGLSLSIPERVRFRYRLTGADKDWHEAGTRREAFYTNLGPGAYRFSVVAANNDGVWGQTAAIQDFIIKPAFYQTIWFRTIVGLSVAGTLWLLYLLRLKQVTTQIQTRLGERLAERERIARELHDTLLQGVQGLILHFEGIAKQIPTHDQTRQLMEKALETADQVLLEGRERVRNLRSETSSGSELSARLAAYGQELTQDTSIAVKVIVSGDVRPLDPIVADEANLIGREAITNSYRHAHASAIEVEVAYEFRSLRLRIRDDGTGISQDTLDRGLPGHWGLAGMRERAEKLGAELSIWSAPGAGTEIELRVHSDIAYIHQQKSRIARLVRWLPNRPGPR